MAIELEKRNLRSYEIRKQKYKRKMRLLSMVAILIAIGIIAFLINLKQNKTYKSYKVLNTTERRDSSSANYLSYKTGVLRYSRDGAVAMDGAGNQLWNGTYQMKNPIADICGNFVAISDRGYKTIQIFDGEGGMTTVEVLNPIIKTEIANQGVIAVLMEGKDLNYFNLFDKDGNSLVTGKTAAQDDGFPIDFALSNDGRKLVTSYVSLNNGSMQSKVTFYNFGGVGQNYIDKMVGGFDFGQTLVADVKFVDNDTVVAFGDNKYRIYSMKERPELVHEGEVKSEIKSILHNENYIGFVLNNPTEENKYSIMLYDLKGNKVLDKAMNYAYQNIYLSGKEIIMYSNQDWIIWRANGSKKIYYKFDNKISSILPVKGSDKYIIVNGANMQEVSLAD